MLKDELLNALKQYPVFSVREIADILDKPRTYAYLVAYRLKKSGIINEIEKGKYTLERDPFIVASWIVWPSYISGWTAINYHKLTEQLPFTIQVVTTRKRKKNRIFYLKTKIEFIKLKKSSFFGFQRIVYQGKQIFMAEKEKAIIDALTAKKISFGEAIEIIKNNRKKLSTRKLLTYSKTIRGLNRKLRGAIFDA